MVDRAIWQLWLAKKILKNLNFKKFQHLIFISFQYQFSNPKIGTYRPVDSEKNVWRWKNLKVQLPFTAIMERLIKSFDNWETRDPILEWRKGCKHIIKISKIVFLGLHPSQSPKDHSLHLITVFLTFSGNFHAFTIVSRDLEKSASNYKLIPHLALAEATPST